MFVYSQAVRTSMYGRPGACYVDVAGDMVNAKVDRSKVRFVIIFWRIFDLFFSTQNCSCDTRLLKFTEVCFSCRVVSCCPPPPVSLADCDSITEAISVLKSAKTPLIIVGKGDMKGVTCSLAVLPFRQRGSFYKS